MANEKKYSAQEAALAVLAKAQELMGKSELFKAEKLKKDFGSNFANAAASGSITPAAIQQGARSVASPTPPPSDVKKGELKKDGSIQAGIAAAGGGGNTPVNAGVASSLGGAFGKAESYCDEHAKDISRKGDHKIVQKSECVKCMSKKENANENEVGTKFMKNDTENKEQPSDPSKPRIEEKPTERDYKDFETKPGHAPENDHREATQTPPGSNPKEKAEGNNPPSGAIPGNGIHKLMYFTGHIHAKKKMKKGIAVS